jgi:hypothetical protein
MYYESKNVITSICEKQDPCRKYVFKIKTLKEHNAEYLFTEYSMSFINQHGQGLMLTLQIWYL